MRCDCREAAAEGGVGTRVSKAGSCRVKRSRERLKSVLRVGWRRDQVQVVHGKKEMEYG